MSRWFRHYVGMMPDPKFGGIARLCKRSRAEVLFVWGCLLESAAEYASSAYSWDADAMADLLAIETDEAQSIHDALEAKGLLSEGRIVAWDRRQFTSDSSTERSRKSRERRRNDDATECNVAAALQQQDATVPETETDTDTAEPNGSTGDAPRKRGARLSPDWTPNPEDLAFAETEGLTPQETSRAADEFRDYWCSRSGRDAAKLDWSRTWRNRVRELADRKRRNGPRLVGQAGAGGFGPRPSSMAGVLAQRRGLG